MFESNAIAYYGNLQRMWEWEGLQVRSVGENEGELEWTRRGIFSSVASVLAWPQSSDLCVLTLQ